MTQSCMRCQAAAAPEARYCQQCGHRLDSSSVPLASLAVVKILGGLFLAMGVILFGGLGACALLLAVADSHGLGGGLAIPLLALAAGCLYGLIKLVQA